MINFIYEVQLKIVPLGNIFNSNAYIYEPLLYPFKLHLCLLLNHLSHILRKPYKDILFMYGKDFDNRRCYHRIWKWIISQDHNLISSPLLLCNDSDLETIQSRREVSIIIEDCPLLWFLYPLDIVYNDWNLQGDHFEFSLFDNICIVTFLSFFDNFMTWNESFKFEKVANLIFQRGGPILKSWHWIIKESYYF